MIKGRNLLGIISALAVASVGAGIIRDWNQEAAIVVKQSDRVPSMTGLPIESSAPSGGTVTVVGEKAAISLSAGCEQNSAMIEQLKFSPAPGQKSWHRVCYAVTNSEGKSWMPGEANGGENCELKDLPPFEDFKLRGCINGKFEPDTLKQFVRIRFSELGL